MFVVRRRHRHRLVVVVVVVVVVKPAPFHSMFALGVTVTAAVTAAAAAAVDDDNVCQLSWYLKAADLHCRQGRKWWSDSKVGIAQLVDKDTSKLQETAWTPSTIALHAGAFQTTISRCDDEQCKGLCCAKCCCVVHQRSGNTSAGTDACLCAFLFLSLVWSLFRFAKSK